MAQRVEVVLTDDLDGGDAAETVTFGLDGVTYEIDLSEANADELREMIDRYTAAGRRVGGRAKAARPVKAATNASSSKAGRDYDLAALRIWAAANGIEVSKRGRVAQRVVDQYLAAGN
jgi:hypothetical protein